VIAVSLKLRSDMVFNAVIATIMFQQVFEKAIHVFEKAWEDSEVKHQFKFWHDLVIRTNLGHDLMFLVFVDGPQDLAPGRIKRLNKELKEFFENGEGKKCGVTSVFTKVMHKYVHLKQCQLSGFIQTALTICYQHSVFAIYCFFFVLYLMTLHSLYSVKWEVDSEHQIRKNVEGNCYDSL
jgi:hypothetical protein